MFEQELDIRIGEYIKKTKPAHQHKCTSKCRDQIEIDIRKMKFDLLSEMKDLKRVLVAFRDEMG